MSNDTILMKAARYGNLGVVKTILQKCNRSEILNIKNNINKSALWYAVEYFSEDIAELLLAQPEIDVTDADEVEIGGYTLLQYAKKRNMKTVVKSIKKKLAKGLFKNIFKKIIS